MSENVKAGGAYVELTVRDKMKQGLDEAKNRFSSFGKQFTAAFGGAFSGVIAGLSFNNIAAKIGEVLNMADDIADASAKIGVSAMFYQEMSHAAQQTGASIGHLSSAILKMQSIVGKAELGNKSAIKTLEKYSLNYEELASMGIEDQFMAIANAIATMPDQSARAAAAMELLGKAGLQMMPLLEGGENSINSLQKQAQKLGLVSSNEDIERAGNLADVFATIGTQVKYLSAAVYNALVPAFESYAELLRGALAWSIAFVDKNRGMIATAYNIAASIAVAMASVAAYRLAIGALSLAVPIYTAATYGATIATAAFNAAILANPVGAVVAAILAAAAAAVYFSGVLSGLGAIASQVFSGIGDAIAGGNLELAWNIATTGMHLAWVQFGENVMKVWDSVVNWVAQKMTGMLNGFINLINGVIAKIEALRGLEAGAMGRINGEFIVSNPSNTSAAWADDRKRLQTELSDLKEQAAKEKAVLNAPDKVGAGSEFDINSMLSRMEKQSKPIFTTAATFNPNAVSSLASPAMRIQQDQLKELEKHTQLLEDVADGIDEPVGVFS